MAASARPAFVDANVLLGPLPKRPFGAPEDVAGLLAAMDQYGIAQALVTHADAKWRDVASGNARLTGEIAGQSRLIPCWTVLPSATAEVAPEPEQVAALLAAGARAARLCPVEHRLSLEPWEVGPLLSALAERRVPLLLDLDNVHWSESRPWHVVEWACRAHPDLPLVLLRESQSRFRTLFALLDRCQNLFVETSYLQGHDAINLIAERWGAHRLVYGSGMPLFDPGLPITGVTYAGLAPDDLAAVAGGSLLRLLEGAGR
jgi:predicted TIM-barrel fold metal-dependent hydrolase